MNLRQTKIVATLGPATDSEEVMAELIRSGLDVARVNFSHGDIEDHKARIALARKHAGLQNRPLAILADLQGPKIRITRFKDDQIELKEGDEFELDVELDEHEGTQERVGVTYKNLTKDVKLGDMLILDDGNIALEVIQGLDAVVRTEVIVGGTLSDSKGNNKGGGGLTAPSLTPNDQGDLRVAGDLEID